MASDQLDSVLVLREKGRRGWTDFHRGHLFRPGRHHGRPPQEPETAPSRNVLCDHCLAAAGDFSTYAMREVFRPSPLARPTEQHDVACLGWNLAGLVTLADWLGSRQAWFPYVHAEAVADPAAYFWSHALPRAAVALAASGLAAVAPTPFAGLRRLFPGITLLPVQQWAETVTLPAGADVGGDRGPDWQWQDRGGGNLGASVARRRAGGWHLPWVADNGDSKRDVRSPRRFLSQVVRAGGAPLARAGA